MGLSLANIKSIFSCTAFILLHIFNFKQFTLINTILLIEMYYAVSPTGFELSYYLYLFYSVWLKIEVL